MGMILLNPRYTNEEKIKFQTALGSIDRYSNHVWLATSGTSGFTKFVALSEKAILTSAAAVNQHLESNATDVWLNPLPEFHVGGLAIRARSKLSGASVVACHTWDPLQFNELLHGNKVTLTALVPTQLFDLVAKKLKPPATLRAVIIGGGALDDILYDHAKNLGWPILPSYGLTECCSQVATATSKSKQLQVLPHVTVKIEDGLICIKSEALLSAYAKIDDTVTITDPKIDEWFRTEDRGELQGKVLKVFGRSSDFIKIGGESVDLLQLDALLNKIKLNLEIVDDMILIATSDPRLGKVIHLLTTGKETDIIVKAFNDQVLPFARIRQVNHTDKIPRTALGKPIRDQNR